MKKFLIISLVFLVSCTGFFRKKTERTLARVYDDYLYENDIRHVVPRGTSEKDSITLVRNYIDNWIHQKLVIHQAESNLTSDQMDFSQQLEDYKNSLVIYAYENELVRQKMDTLVTDEDVEQHYEQNSQNFLLKENIVQIRYVKLPKDSKMVKQFRKWLDFSDPEEKLLLVSQCSKFATDYYLDDENWISFNDLLNQVPIKTYNEEDFLKNRKFLEYQDSLYIYLVKFRDFKIKESVSPLSFEKERIKNIILNKRKSDLIQKMRDDLYSNASRKNDFEIF
ncbi:MAG: hypothetical protein ACM3N9_02775 [Syntrophothermus sp.]